MLNRQTPFHGYVLTARRAALPPVLQPYAAEIGSDQFEAFCRLEGLQAVPALLAGTKFMLEHGAPDPSQAAFCEEALADGEVLMHYADVCNPFPSFSLPVGCEALAELQRCWQASLASRRYRAAVRYKHWNGLLCSFTEQRQVRMALKRFEESHPMPKREDYPLSSDLTDAVSQWAAQRNAVKERLRLKRIQRVQRVEQATRSPAQLADWHSLLEALMVQVMLPAFRAEQALEAPACV